MRDQPCRSAGAAEKCGGIQVGYQITHADGIDVSNYTLDDLVPLLKGNALLRHFFFTHS